MSFDHCVDHVIVTQAWDSLQLMGSLGDTWEPFMYTSSIHEAC